jgi:energy-coupling factor transporter ATP-binding protein EcfA2
MSMAVRAEQVAFRYPQHDFGLCPTSLRLDTGEAVFISGPSGSGKSTLARCLVGLIPHLYRGEVSGAVWLDGLNTTQTPMWRLSEQAGLVFQNPAAQILAPTVEEEIIFGLENLGLSRGAIRERLDETLNRFGMDRFRRRAPQTLSGGEKQKLALAAIMAREPPVLVLDEPLSMLDSSAAVELIEHLAALACQGVTIIVCEHRAEYLSSIGFLRTVEMGGTAAAELPQAREHQPIPVDVRESGFSLEVSNLTVKLGGRTILREFSFGAQGGQVIAVVGRNGIGKTTLLRALAGLQSFSGDVSVNGELPEFGLVFQNADLHLFNATVRDEILFRLPEPDMARYAWLMEMLGLTAYETTPPLLLSEGEKKRVALAAVLMRAPRHGILLDEPALGQDVQHKTRLMDTARMLAAAGMLVLMTTHDLTLAAQADRLLLLGPDGLAADGPPDQVLADEAPWARLGLVVPEWVRPTVAADFGAAQFPTAVESAVQ